MNFISADTLYYLFSTIAQVLAATTALVAIALQFKINALRKHLIGDGQAINRRAIRNDLDVSLSDQSFKRLEDSISREDLGGIKAVLKELSELEKESGATLEEKPRGLQHLYSRFSKLHFKSEQMREMIPKVAFLSILTIIFSIIALSLIDLIENYFAIKLIVVVIITILSILSLWRTYNGIKLGLS